MKILKLQALISKTGLSKSSVYQRISDGTFPEQISLGGRSVGWIESEIDDWLKQQVELSRKSEH